MYSFISFSCFIELARTLKGMVRGNIRVLYPISKGNLQVSHHEVWSFLQIFFIKLKKSLSIPSLLREFGSWMVIGFCWLWFLHVIDMDMIMQISISYSTCKPLINNNEGGVVNFIGSMMYSIATGKVASMTLKIVQHSMWMAKNPTIF